MSSCKHTVLISCPSANATETQDIQCFPKKRPGRSDSHQFSMLPASSWLLICALGTDGSKLSLSLICTGCLGQACLVGPVFPSWSQRILLAYFVEVYRYCESQHLDGASICCGGVQLPSPCQAAASHSQLESKGKRNIQRSFPVGEDRALLGPSFLVSGAGTVLSLFLQGRIWAATSLA